LVFFFLSSLAQATTVIDLDEKALQAKAREAATAGVKIQCSQAQQPTLTAHVPALSRAYVLHRGLIWVVDADSGDLVRHCDSLLRERGWRVGNTDITVICERPKVGPHALAMRERIGGLLQLPLDAVSVKATTSEKLGFTGRGEGIAAQAVVLLVAA